MKKLWVPILAVLLGVLVLAGTLVYLLIALPKAAPKAEEPSVGTILPVEDYIKTTWPDYRFVSYAGGVLELDYEVQGDYEQIKKHGGAAGYDALAEGHLETAALILRGCDIQSNVQPRELVVVGRTKDGQEVYRASTLEGVSACWDEPAG